VNRTMRCETVALGCHRLRIGLFERFSSVSHLPPGRRLSGAPVARPQAPVTENQTPGGSPTPFVTNTIGAMHGLGKSTLPLNEASPVAVAGNGAVTRFTITAAPASTD